MVNKGLIRPAISEGVRDRGGCLISHTSSATCCSKKIFNQVTRSHVKLTKTALQSHTPWKFSMDTPLNFSKPQFYPFLDIFSIYSLNFQGV